MRNDQNQLYMDAVLLKEYMPDEEDAKMDTHVEIERLHHDIRYIKWTTTCTLSVMILYMITYACMVNTLMVEWKT